jgi:hypothetical protein
MWLAGYTLDVVYLLVVMDARGDVCVSLCVLCGCGCPGLDYSLGQLYGPVCPFDYSG